MLSPMNSASSKNEVSKSVGAVGLACGAVSEVFGESVGAGFGSVATAVVSGSVVSVVVAAVVADVDGGGDEYDEQCDFDDHRVCLSS